MSSLERTELMIQAVPGESLVSMATDGDDEATAILANVIHRMSGCRPPSRCPTVEDWAKGFDRYSASCDSAIPHDLLDDAHRCYVQLATSQGETTLLHGDLHEKLRQDLVVFLAVNDDLPRQTAALTEPNTAIER